MWVRVRVRARVRVRVRVKVMFASESFLLSPQNFCLNPPARPCLFTSALPAVPHTGNGNGLAVGSWSEHECAPPDLGRWHPRACKVTQSTGLSGKTRLEGSYSGRGSPGHIACSRPPAPEGSMEVTPRAVMWLAWHWPSKGSERAHLCQVTAGTPRGPGSVCQRGGTSQLSEAPLAALMRAVCLT